MVRCLLNYSSYLLYVILKINETSALSKSSNDYNFISKIIYLWYISSPNMSVLSDNSVPGICIFFLRIFWRLLQVYCFGMFLVYLESRKMYRKFIHASWKIFKFLLFSWPWLTIFSINGARIKGKPVYKIKIRSWLV